MSYASVASILDRIGRLGYQSFGFTDSNSFESYVSDLIARASRMIDRYCGVPEGFFSGGSRITVSYRGSDICIDRVGRVYVILPYTPIIAVEEVKVNIGDDLNPVFMDAVYTYAGSALYIHDNPSRYLTLSMYVTYTAGYISTPSDISSIVVESVASFLLEYLRFIRNERVDVPVLQLRNTEILDKYRCIPFAKG